MTASLAFDALLSLLLVGVAAGAVLLRQVFTAIVLFIVFGLGVALAWAKLGAVDVSLAEAAIGAGLTGVLLVRAAARLGNAAPVDSLSPLQRVAIALLCAALAGVLAFTALALPASEGLAGAAAAALPQSGVTHAVTAVLLNFRGYDTLLETVVLLMALVAVWSFCSDEAAGGVPGLPEHARPGGVLASFARMLLPAGLLVGLHLFWAGAQAPGGAFQAGTVLAAVWLLAAMASVAPVPAVASRRVRALVVAGPASFLAVASAALPAGGFLVFPPAHAKLLILAVEAALTVSIAAILALLVMGAPRRAA